MADGAAALRAHPAAMRLVGADIMCSLVYGTQTVLLLLVARHAGLGLQGYGYLFAGIGVGGAGRHALASRLCRSAPARACCPPPWPPSACRCWSCRGSLGRAGHRAGRLTGTGAMLVEILTETCLQRVTG